MVIVTYPKNLKHSELNIIKEKIYSLLAILYIYYSGSSSCYFIAYECSIMALMGLFYFNISIFLICFGGFDFILTIYPKNKIEQYLFVLITFFVPLFLILKKIFKKNIVIEYTNNLNKSPKLKYYNWIVFIYSIISFVLFILIAGLFSPL